MIHQVSSPPDNIMVHIADFGCDIFIDGIADSGKEPIVIHTSSRNPIVSVEGDENLILNYVAEAWRKSQRYREFKQLPVTHADIIPETGSHALFQTAASGDFPERKFIAP